MAKNYDRGLGRSMRMHDRLIERAQRTVFSLPEEGTTPDPQHAAEPKRAWTPERWAHRIIRATAK
jgi:hypothetical protein